VSSCTSVRCPVPVSDRNTVGCHSGRIACIENARESPLTSTSSWSLRITIASARPELGVVGYATSAVTLRNSSILRIRSQARDGSASVHTVKCSLVSSVHTGPPSAGATGNRAHAANTATFTSTAMRYMVRAFYKQLAW